MSRLPLMKSTEVAQLAGVTPHTVWRWGREDSIPGAVVRLPGSRAMRFRREVVEQYFAKSPSDEAPK